MSVQCFSGVTTNPELLEIADRAYVATRLSMQRSILSARNNPRIIIPNKSVENSSLVFFKKYLDPTGRITPVLDKLSNVSRTRFDLGNPNSLASKANLRFEAPQPVFEQLKTKGFFKDLVLSSDTIANHKWDPATRKFSNFSGSAKLYAEKIMEIIQVKQLEDVEPGDTPRSNPGSTPPAPARAKEVHLKLARLNCIRKCGWEITDFGDDSIYCGGDGIDSNSTHVEVPQFFIDKFQKNGQSKNIGPDKTFVKFSLTKGDWPKSFIANVFLTEKDANGGFVKFLNDLWDAIGEEVVSIVSALAVAAAGAAIGTAIGLAAGSVIPVLGTIVATVICAVIGYLVGWLIGSLNDDIFQSNDNPIGLILDSPESLFSGGRTRSSNLYQDFHCGEARYRMKYYWQLVY